VIVPLLQINSETKKEHHAACSILQPHSIFRVYSGHQIPLYLRISWNHRKWGKNLYKWAPSGHPEPASISIKQKKS
ncbi:MAG: hypothetical protein CMM74_03700, partial [Rhodospirillaceae bacterium]|nr:hypothetical protein [Rhodospirillaceae bacterium]